MSLRHCKSREKEEQTVVVVVMVSRAMAGFRMRLNDLALDISYTTGAVHYCLMW